jgi:hypothetical protein
MRKLTWLIALAVPSAFIACQKESVQKQAAVDAKIEHAVTSSTGNGAPSGAHYNLNIIGVPNGKTADMTGNSGGRIFVSLNGKTRINLLPGTDFQVTDANGTDGTAEFHLPNPDPESDGTTTYRVYARVPGNQQGSAHMTTCADGVVINDVEYPVQLDCEGITFDADNYKKFTNVTANLLYVTILSDVWVDVNNDGIQDPGEVLKAGRYPIFDERLYGYFWEYDNQGLKLLQLRFYWIPDTVTGVVQPTN